MNSPGSDAAASAEADNSASMVAVEQSLRPAEETNALLIGFATGLLIGGFFLIYVVLSIANPTF